MSDARRDACNACNAPSNVQRDAPYNVQYRDNTDHTYCDNTETTPDMDSTDIAIDNASDSNNNAHISDCNGSDIADFYAGFDAGSCTKNITDAHESILDSRESILKAAHNSYYDNSYCVTAARIDRFDLLEYAVGMSKRNKDYKWKMCHNTGIAALTNSNIEMFRWACENGCPISVDMCNKAAEIGDLKTLEWLSARGYEADYWGCYHAIVNGHFEVMRYIVSKKLFKLDSKLANTAAFYKQHDIVIWLYENGCPWSAGIYETLAHEGHLETLKYFHERGIQLKRLDPRFGYLEHELTEAAASTGNLETLKWLISIGHEISSEEYLKAAEEGHINVLEYLHSINSDVHDNAVTYSLKNGQLESVKWLLAHGHQIDKLEWFAYDGFNLEIYEWLVEKGYKLDIAQVAYAAARNGKIDLLEFLRNNGYELTERMCFGAINGHQLETLEWLFENGCPCDLEKCKDAAQRFGDDRIQDFLAEY